MASGAKDVDVRGVDVNWRHTNPLLRSQRYENATDDEILRRRATRVQTRSALAEL